MVQKVGCDNFLSSSSRKTGGRDPDRLKLDEQA